MEHLFYPRLEIVCKRMNFDEGWRDAFVTHALQMADESMNTADLWDKIHALSSFLSATQMHQVKEIEFLRTVIVYLEHSQKFTWYNKRLNCSFTNDAWILILEIFF